MVKNTLSKALGAHTFRVSHRTLEISGLPDAFEGFRIGQISDLHIGSFTTKHAFGKGVWLLQNENPDVIFFTGDLINARAEECDPFMDLLEHIQAPHGVYAVLGNHDYGGYEKWSSKKAREANFNQLLDTFKHLQWDLLLNESRLLNKGDEAIGIAGVENWGRQERMPKRGDLEAALQGLEGLETIILLSHDPTHWKDKVLPHPAHIDLTLSGHTHGAQFGLHTKRLRWSPAQYVYKHWSGLYQEDGQYLYVNRGFGYHGFPGRIGMPAEITILTLKKAANGPTR